jgi:hypothetical protein
MSQLVAVRSSDGRSVVANVPLKVARGMVDRGEAEWTGNSRSIQLARKQFDWNGSSCRPGELIFAYACDKNAGRRTAVTAVIDGIAAEGKKKAVAGW